VGTDGSFGHQNSERSVISAIGRSITPLFEPMGIQPDNWPATVGIFTGLFAKEVVVGTLDALYSSDVAASNEAFVLGDALLAALHTVPANLAALAQRLGDPLGLDVGQLDDQSAVAEAQAVQVSTLGTLTAKFGTSAAAFAYLLFVLLYAPCVATIAAIYKEMGGTWAGFSLGWSLVLGYGTAVLYYQIATAAAHPLATAAWGAGMLVLFASGFSLLIRWGKQEQARIERLRSQMIPVVNV